MREKEHCIPQGECRRCSWHTAEVPMQPMELLVLCSARTAAQGEDCGGAGLAGSGNLQWCSPFLRDCVPWEEPILDHFTKDYMLWEGPCTELGKRSRIK